ncbi:MULTISPECIES: hypothetical protein [unclassified Methylobacterium]|uniref:hypothetical protein n=1 Tax=unclassified Methylobacterium TaxID=2615210 RepID=UPI0006F38EBC|nr:MULTISPECIES: hypothetical protein [unclassified Methylobacterium]KQO76460.1 hypothetical protein ASF20_14030 [Methylobacterium sp. Leaf88]KQP75754.1 hypothetical protein ASF41_15000 [Methylobacterium sp. Leaf111]
MVLILLAAMGGGMLSTALLLPYGILTALLGAPLTASLCAAAAGAVILLRRGDDGSTDVAFDEAMDDRTDAMVKMLRDIAAKGRETGADAERPARNAKAA